MPSTLLLPLPLPADEVKIGSFLLNPSDPTQDYFDPQEKDPDLKPSILRVDVTDFTNTIRDAETKEVQAMLTGYFSTTVDWAKSKSLELSSAKAATYLMKNSGTWFQQACALAPMRWWFEWVTRRGHKIYLLVGLRTVFDGRFKIEHSASTSTGGQIKVPADVLAGLPPIGLDIGGGGKVSKDRTASSEFSAAGERIWALQYRQIKFKWYSSKKMENAALETGTRWVTFNRSANSRVMWSGSRDDSKDLLRDGISGETGYSERLKRPSRKSHTCSRRRSYTMCVQERLAARERIGKTTQVCVGGQFTGQKRKRIGETLVEDTEDMVEAFIDDELDLEDQFEVQKTNEETILIPRQAEIWVPLVPPGSRRAQQAKSWVRPLPIPLPSHLRTAADAPEEDVQLSSEASIIERAEHLE